MASNFRFASDASLVSYCVEYIFPLLHIQCDTKSMFRNTTETYQYVHVLLNQRETLDTLCVYAHYKSIFQFFSIKWIFPLRTLNDNYIQFSNISNIS